MYTQTHILYSLKTIASPHNRIYRGPGLRRPAQRVFLRSSLKRWFSLISLSPRLATIALHFPACPSAALPTALGYVTSLIAPPSRSTPCILIFILSDTRRPRRWRLKQEIRVTILLRTPQELTWNILLLSWHPRAFSISRAMCNKNKLTDRRLMLLYWFQRTSSDNMPVASARAWLNQGKKKSATKQTTSPWKRVCKYR